MAAIFLGPIADLVGSIITRIWPDKTEVEKIKGEVMLAMMKGEFDVQLTSIQAVNATMQAEAKSEHWAQWLWRPVIGFSFGAVIVNNYIIMPYLAKWLTPIQVPSEVWTAMLVILGASAAGRSFEKWQKNNNGNSK